MIVENEWFLFHLLVTVGCFIGLLVCDVIWSVYLGENERTRCACRRTRYDRLIFVGAHHPKSRYMLLSALLLVGPCDFGYTNVIPDHLWWIQAPGYFAGGIGFSWGIKYIWHEIGRWKKGLKRAWRWVKRTARNSVRVVSPAPAPAVVRP
jgi:hypothetical protein